MAIPIHSWREQILKEFTPYVAITLVADPDNLLTEELLLLDIQARGFELFHFEDPITFRFAYESKYRDRMEGGELSLVVILIEPQPLLSSFASAHRSPASLQVLHQFLPRLPNLLVAVARFAVEWLENGTQSARRS